MSDKKINIAIIGLGFGAEFIPIYQKHPNANLVAIVFHPGVVIKIHIAIGHGRKFYPLCH